MFLPSYSFLNTVTAEWRTNGTLDKFSNKKKVGLNEVTYTFAQAHLAIRCFSSHRKPKTWTMYCVTMLQLAIARYGHRSLYYTLPDQMNQPAFAEDWKIWGSSLRRRWCKTV